MSILNKVCDEKFNQTEVEKNLAEFLIGDLSNIEKWNPSYIAQRAYISKPSITRYSQKLGFKGFNDFHIHLKLEFMNSKSENEFNDHGVKDKISLFQTKLTNSIQIVKKSIDKINFNRLSSMIETKRRIIFLTDSKWETLIRKILKNKIMQKSNIFVFNWADIRKKDLGNFDVNDVIINFYITNYDSNIFEKTKLLIDKQNVSLINIVESGNLWFEHNFKNISINIPYFENDDDGFFREMYMLYVVKAIKTVL